MLPAGFLNKNKKVVTEYAAIAVAYLTVSILMFPTFAAHMGTVVPGSGGDTYQSLWELWWVPYAIFILHVSPYSTYMIYYPVGASLITQTMAPLAGIFTAPLQAIGLAFTYNFLFFLGFVLSGLFMYLLANHITKSRNASFIAGLIYSLAPMHVMQSLGHLQWTNIEFIPLFVLFLIEMLEERKIKHAFGAAISFVLLTFMGDMEQAIITIIIAALILAYYLLFRRRAVLDMRFLIAIVTATVVAFLISLPFLIPIIHGMQNGALSSVNLENGIQYNILYSSDILSFFLPSFMNPIFHDIAMYYYNIFLADPTERVTYMGYSVIFLALAGLAYRLRKKERFEVGLWLVAAIIFAWLSLGPYLQVGGNITKIPGLFMLFRDIPMLNLLREADRFDFALVLSVAMLAAIGFKELESRVRINKNHLLAIFALLIFVEYYAMPITYPGFMQNYTSSAYIPRAYSELANVPGNYTVLVLPALENPYSTAPELYPGLALYYQTAFKKPLVGGYTGRSNATELEALETVPLIDIASSMEVGNGMTYYSPINENYTNLSLLWLYEYRTSFISIIRSAYNYGDLGTLAAYLYSVFGTPVYQSNDTIVFSTAAAIDSEVGKSIVSYTIGQWYPGWSLCQQLSIACNSSVESEWFGNYSRGIGIFMPSNETNTSIRFTAMSYSTPSKLYVYKNNIPTPIAILSLSGTPKAYTINTSMQRGLNLVAFVSAQNYQSQYFNFGMENITVT